MQVVPEGHDCDEPQPGTHVDPLQRKPAGQRPDVPEHGVPVAPPVDGVHVPDVEQISPLAHPAEGLHVAPHTPPEQCNPMSHAASVAQTLPQSEP
jgi:hypothetical protein